MRVPIRNSAIALILHVIILAVMLFGLKLGIYSVVYANMLFALFVCLLNGRAIARYLRYRQEIRRTFLIPSIASLFMGVVAYGTYQLCSSLLWAPCRQKGSSIPSAHFWQLLWQCSIFCAAVKNAVCQRAGAAWNARRNQIAPYSAENFISCK